MGASAGPLPAPRGRLVPRDLAQRSEDSAIGAPARLHRSPQRRNRDPVPAHAWHTVRSAELWLYHSGGPLLLEVGAEQHSATTHLLGADITAGESPQYVVPPGYWQRAVPRDDEPCLVSCVVVPGFDFADFVLGASTD